MGCENFKLSVSVSRKSDSRLKSDVLRTRGCGCCLKLDLCGCVAGKEAELGVTGEWGRSPPQAGDSDSPRYHQAKAHLQEERLYSGRLGEWMPGLFPLPYFLCFLCWSEDYSGSIGVCIQFACLRAFLVHCWCAETITLWLE